MQLRALVDDAAITAALRRLLAVAASPIEYLGPIGRHVAETTRQRFGESRSPTNAAWDPVLRGGRPLFKTGTHLRNQVDYRVEGNSVLVGVPYFWASVHQFGKVIKAKNKPYLRFQVDSQWYKARQVKIPARPFLGISADDRIGITQILQRVLVGK